MGLDLQKTIYEAHKVALGDTLVAIVFCGSVTQKISGGSDIDFLVIAASLDFESAQTIARVREELERQLKVPASNTVITAFDVKDLNNQYNRLDGKAVQALIEARSEAIYTEDAGFRIPQLRAENVKDFSTHNFHVLKALLMKHLIRSSSINMSSEEKTKLAKISLIMQKMYLQANQPVTSPANIDLYTGITDADKLLHKNLLQIKKLPSLTDDKQVRSIVLQILGLKLQ